MSPLAVKLVSWVLHALVVMASVAFVSPRNPRNTLLRALVVTVLVAVLVTPFAGFWFLIVPALIAFVAWIIVYTGAYGIGIGQSLLAGFVQALLGMAVDLFAGRYHW